MIKNATEIGMIQLGTRTSVHVQQMIIVNCIHFPNVTVFFFLKKFLGNKEQVAAIV